MYIKFVNKRWLVSARVLLLALVMSSHIPSFADGTAIKLMLSDGNSHLFLLEDEPYARFIGDTLVISSKKNEINIILDSGNIVKVVYIDDVPSSVDELKEMNLPSFLINEFGITVMGLEPKTNVFIYDLKGVLVSKAVVERDGSIQIPINGTGIYVVKTEVSSFKIMK